MGQEAMGSAQTSCITALLKRIKQATNLHSELYILFTQISYPGSVLY